MAIRCRIEEDFMSNKVKVYLAMDGPRPHVLELRDSSFVWVELPEGSIIEPSMVLDNQVLEALLREATDFVPATDATTKHLEDSMATRDRLLRLVEKTHGKK